MIILGVDPSLNSTGFCFLNCTQDNSFKTIEYGSIDNNKLENTFEKIANIYKILDEKMSTNPIDLISIEETFVNVNPRTSLKLGMVRGCIYTLAIKYDTKIVEYEPKFIKKTITGKGSADKNQILYMTKHLINGFNPKNDDESDAAAIAITAYFMKNIPSYDNLR